jgi:hypothetical protein
MERANEPMRCGASRHGALEPETLIDVNHSCTSTCRSNCYRSFLCNCLAVSRRVFRENFN